MKNLIRYTRDLVCACAFFLWRMLLLDVSRLWMWTVVSCHRLRRKPRAPGSSKPAYLEPCDACLSWEWHTRVLVKLGLTCVLIEAPAVTGTQGPEFISPRLFEWLGARLEEENLGMFDCPRFDPLTARYFYNVPTDGLSKALALIKAEIGTEVLKDVRIGYADAKAKAWRTFHPDVPALASN